MRLTIDHDACTGHGRCYSVAPELFDADDDGAGVVRADTGGGAASRGVDDALFVAQRAVDSCPERAVRLTT